jgi:hypothetical protein
MALTLKQDLEHLDNQIAGIRAQREASHDNAERERLQRSITMLDTHERAAIRKNHEERAAKRADEEQAANAFQQQQAAKQEQADRAMLRRRWTGDDKSFQEAYPKMLEQLRMDRALGRAVSTDVPSPQVKF